MSRNNHFFLQFATILLVAGMISLLSMRIFIQVDEIFASKNSEEPVATIVSNQVDKLNESVVKNTVPDRVYFPLFDLSLDISEGVIKNNEWTLYNDRVSWLSTSALPSKGNVILYAHNLPHLFGNLNKLSKGNEIVIMHDQNTYKYVVDKVVKVSPNDIDAVTSSQNQLTLYTCDGSFDQRRLIVTALPI